MSFRKFVTQERPALFLCRALLFTATLALAFALGRVTAGEPAAAPQVLSIPSFLSRHPIEEGEPLRVVPLAQGQDLSATTVRVTGEMKPHLHHDREEIVYLIRGGGTLLLGDQKRPVKPGDVIYIPRGVLHGFTNGARGETVAFSVMAPPFDGKDRHEPDRGPVEAAENGRAERGD